MGIKILMIVTLFYIGLASSFAGDDRASLNTPEAPCPMMENSQINISFNSQETDLAQIKSIMDDNLKGIESLANEAGVDKFELQSMNYSIYANNAGGCNCSPGGGNVNSVYQLSGNMSFNVLPSEKATNLMVLLNKKGYVSGLNVNMYRQCH